MGDTMEEAASDPYASDVHRWWHLSRPSPELVQAAEAGWIAPRGRVLDVGCGLGTELGFLSRSGFRSVGVDLSSVALERASALHPEAFFLRADALRLPFGVAVFDLLLDRGCFHYLTAAGRSGYAAEARRVLRPSGRMLLRACLCSAGVRNDIDETALRQTFAGWRWLHLSQRGLITDTRVMPALVTLLEPIPEAGRTATL